MTRRRKTRAWYARRRARLQAVERATVARIIEVQRAAPPTTPLSVSDLPGIERALDCAADLYFHADDAPDVLGLRGSGFWIKPGKNMRNVLVATKHAIRPIIDGGPTAHLCTPATRERKVLRVGQPRELLTSVQMLLMNPTDPEDDDQDDVAIMLFRDSRLSRHFRPVPIERFASQYDFRPGTLFAVAGFPTPREGMRIDYPRHIGRPRLNAIGTYIERSSRAKAVHTINLDPSPMFGDPPDGLSGSPVLVLEPNAPTGLMDWKVAGILIRAGNKLAHFVEAIRIQQLLARIVSDAIHQHRMQSG